MNQLRRLFLVEAFGMLILIIVFSIIIGGNTANTLFSMGQKSITAYIIFGVNAVYRLFPW